jgi:uncharacterized repeat protein (TIGR01451 family)
MKNVSTFLFVLLFAVKVIGQSGSGFWEEIEKPPGGVFGVQQLPNGWLVGGQIIDTVMYYSSDTANTWKPLMVLPNGLPKDFIKFGRAGAFFYRDSLISQDYGNTWTAFDSGGGRSNYLQSEDGTLFAVKAIPANDSHSIMKSIDNGLTWTQIHQPIPNQPFRPKPTMYMQGADCVILEYYPSTSYLARKYSCDKGNTWNQAPQPDAFVAFSTTSNRLISFWSSFIITHNGIDNYIDLETLLGKSPGLVLGVCEAQNGDVYVSTRGGIVKADSTFTNWEKVSNCETVNFNFPRKLVNGKFLISQDFGDFKQSVNLEDDFLYSATGLKNAGTIHYYDESSNGIMSVTQSGLWMKSHSDTNWVLRSPSFEYKSFSFELEVDQFNEGMMVQSKDTLLIWSIPEGHITKSTLPFTVKDAYDKFHLFYKDSLVFVNSENGIMRSKDLGKTWSIFNDTIHMFEVIKMPNDSIFFGIFGKTNVVTNRMILKSTDFGISWQPVNLGLNSPYRLTVSNDGLIVFANSGNTLYSTFDFISGITKISQISTSIRGIEFIDNTLVVSGTDRVLRGKDLSKPLTSTPIFPNQASLSNSSYHLNRKIMSDFKGRIIFLCSRNWFDRRLYRSKSPISLGASIEGSTYKDSDADCNTPDPEAPLPNWIVSATKGSDTWSTNTDSLGRYSMFIDTGTYKMTTSVPADIFWVRCADSIDVNLPVYLDTVEQDLPSVATVDCPYISVDLAIGWLNPCFESTAALSVHNYGTVAADTVWVDVQFPTEVYVIDTTMQYDSLGMGLYRFWFGALGIGEGSQATFDIATVCDTALTAQVLCFTAQAYPDSLCTVPVVWSGAQIEVTAACQGDTTVRFELKNTTNTATQNLDFIIIEDHVVLRQGNNQYGPQQVRTETVPMAQGAHLYRLQSEQEPGHPFATVAFAWVEGCGPGTGSAGNFIQQYMMDNGIPSQDVECVQVTSSYDPNDKQGQPIGYGAQHQIEPNTDLEYTIRFQNTGTAAARFVVIRDSLSAHLDPTSIRVGAASHPYTWTLSGQGNLMFRFDQINLPDSNTNAVASQGFISFKISQKADLPLGTAVQNKASIYFDYNGAVVTNTTLHTIGRDFIILTTAPPSQTVSDVTLNPNPTRNNKQCTLNGLVPNEQFRFIATDATGHQQLALTVTGPQANIDCSSLADGIYFFRLIDALGVRVGQGKLIVVK